MVVSPLLFLKCRCLVAARRLCAASAIRRRSRQAWRSASWSAGSFARRSRLDVVHDRAGPIDAPLHLRKDVRIDALVALDVVAHAARRVEVDGLERPHEGPAQRKAFADADIDVLDAGIAVGDEPEGFLQQRALHPVHDEAVELALHHDRRLAGGDAGRRALARRSRATSRAPARLRRPG